jgi:hypothetical protein
VDESFLVLLLRHGKTGGVKRVYPGGLDVGGERKLARAEGREGKRETACSSAAAEVVGSTYA